MAIKTVELGWDGTHWRDRFSGVKIPEGIYPPPDQQAEAIGTTLEEWTGKGPPPDYRGGAETVHQHFAELFQSGHHPFDKSFTVTYEQVQVTYEQVQKMIDQKFETLENLRSLIREDWLPALIEKALEDRVVGANMHFAHRDKLATAGFVREVVDGTNRDVEWLTTRIIKIERPWYKRWFSR